eukprot:3683663-Prymnesium_polylepis.1
MPHTHTTHAQVDCQPCCQERSLSLRHPPPGLLTEPLPLRRATSRPQELPRIVAPPPDDRAVGGAVAWRDSAQA